jgi:hypothetical protein
VKYVFPATYGENCVLVPIDAALIPLVSGAILHFQQRGYWKTETDYEQGYNAFAELQASMANNCLSELVESNRQIYRLLDSTFNGTEYTASGDTPPEISPAIAAVPPASIGAENALRAHVGRLWQLSENMTSGRTFGPGAGIDGSQGLDNDRELRAVLAALQGILPSGWFGWGDQPATIADLVRAVRADTEGQIERVKDSFNALQTLAQGATVFDVVGGFLTEGAEITAEGGILATLIVSTMAQAAMMGAQAGQLDELLVQLRRLVTSMDGGAEIPPETNVISELQAANEKLV